MNVCDDEMGENVDGKPNMTYFEVLSGSLKT